MIGINNLARLHASIHVDLMGAIQRVINSNEYILGAEVETFERTAATFLGVAHAVGVASGTAALELALKGLDVRERCVLTTSFSFAATGTAILAAGGIPAFCDIDPGTLQMDVPQALTMARRLLPKAIIPVHLYGQMLDITPLRNWARSNDAYVVEDAAQAFGARQGTSFAGACGDVGCFSFFPTKNLGALGDGGLVVTNNAELAHTIRALREPLFNGRASKHSTNSRLDALQAAALGVKIKHLDQWNRTRRDIGRRYNEAFGSLKGMTCPQIRAGDIVHQYTIRVPNRNQLMSFLEERGIGTRIYYNKPLPAYLGLTDALSECPAALSASNEVLSLPMHPFLTADEQQTVINAVRDFSSLEHLQ